MSGTLAGVGYTGHTISLGGELIAPAESTATSGVLTGGSFRSGSISVPGYPIFLPTPVPTPVVIESLGSVTLTSLADIDFVNNQYYADGQLITFNGAPLTTSATTTSFSPPPPWRPVAADVVDGVNTVVLRHSSGHLHFWRMDSEWRQVSGDGWVAPGSAPFHATELAFDADFDGNGVVTILDRNMGEQRNGTPSRLTLAYSVFNDNLEVNGWPITYNGGPAKFHDMVAAGWTPVVADVDHGVNTDAYYGVATVVLRHSSGNIHFWRMDGGWTQVSGDGWVAPGTSDFFAAEVAYGVDLDGDGGLTIEAAGSVVFGYDPNGNIRANNTLVMFNGGPMNYHSMVAAGWRPMAADVENGVNTIVLRHATGHLHFWRMDVNWTQVGGDGWFASSSRDFFVAEKAFGVDLNGDGVRTIEASGNFLLLYDRFGELRVPRVVSDSIWEHGSFIRVNGFRYNYQGGLKAGWAVMAADLHDNQNTVLLKHTATGYLHFWRMDATWNAVGGDGWVAPASPLYFATEVAFGVDLDGNGLVGS